MRNLKPITLTLCFLSFSVLLTAKSPFIGLEKTIKLGTPETDYTFCIGDISLTLYDSGVASLQRHGLNGTILKTLLGDWKPYGSPTDMPGQTIKIDYKNGTDDTYTLIRDGLGKPSVLLDSRGRRYTLCKTQKSTSSVSSDELEEKNKKLSQEYYKNKTIGDNNTPFLSKFIGKWVSTDSNCASLVFEITEIPYLPGQTFDKFETEMKFLPNEKKIGLQLRVTKNGEPIFTGGCYIRDYSISDKHSLLFFSDKVTTCRLSISLTNKTVGSTGYFTFSELNGVAIIEKWGCGDNELKKISIAQNEKVRPK